PPCSPRAPCTLAPSNHRPASTSCKSTPPRSHQDAIDRHRAPGGSAQGHWANASDKRSYLPRRSQPARCWSNANRSLRTVSSSSPPLSCWGWLIANLSASRRSLLDDYQVLQCNIRLTREREIICHTFIYL